MSVLNRSSFSLLLIILFTPMVLLIFGLGFSIKWEFVRDCIKYINSNLFFGFTAVIILLILSICSFFNFLKTFYIFKKDVKKNLPFFLLFTFIISSTIGLIMIFKFNYKISFIPQYWDNGAVLICFAISFTYILLIPGPDKFREKIFIFISILPEKNCLCFHAGHGKLKNEVRNQIRLFQSSYKNATADERGRLKKWLQECDTALDGVIAAESNISLVKKYKKLSADIKILIKSVDFFKHDINYARFILKERTYNKNTDIKRIEKTLDEVLLLKY